MRDLEDLLVLVARKFLQAAKGFRFVEICLFHEHTLGSLEDLAVFECLA